MQPTIRSQKCQYLCDTISVTKSHRVRFHPQASPGLTGALPPPRRACPLGLTATADPAPPTSDKITTALSFALLQREAGLRPLRLRRYLWANNIF